MAESMMPIMIADAVYYCCRCVGLAAAGPFAVATGPVAIAIAIAIAIALAVAVDAGVAITLVSAACYCYRLLLLSLLPVVAACCFHLFLLPLASAATCFCYRCNSRQLLVLMLLSVLLLLSILKYLLPKIRVKFVVIGVVLDGMINQSIRSQNGVWKPEDQIGNPRSKMFSIHAPTLRE